MASEPLSVRTCYGDSMGVCEGDCADGQRAGSQGDSDGVDESDSAASVEDPKLPRRQVGAPLKLTEFVEAEWIKVTGKSRRSAFVPGGRGCRFSSPVAT